MARFPRSWMCYCEDRTGYRRVNASTSSQSSGGTIAQTRVKYAGQLADRGHYFHHQPHAGNLAGKYAPFTPHTLHPSCDITATTKVHLSTPQSAQAGNCSQSPCLDQVMVRLLRPPSTIWMVVACGAPQSDTSVTGGTVQSVHMSPQISSVCSQAAAPGPMCRLQICVGAWQQSFSPVSSVAMFTSSHLSISSLADPIKQNIGPCLLLSQTITTDTTHQQQGFIQETA